MTPIEHATGGYAYIPALPFASAAVVSLPGTTMVRAAFASPVPIDVGFKAARAHLADVGRPLEALCGFEVRIPAVLDWPGFGRFNEGYVARLDAWGLLRDGAPPLGRTNVAPTFDPPAEDSVIAFSYTVEAGAEGGPKAFLVSGVPEIPAGGSYPDDVLRRGETSDEALFDKTRCAVTAVQTRIDQLGAVWDESCTVHLYSRWPLVEVFGRRVLADAGIRPAHGIVWHDTDPPIVDLELEVDVRRYDRELLLPG